MAENKKNKSKTIIEKKVEKTVKKGAKKAVKKIKTSKGLLITVIVLVLIVAIALGGLYFFAPNVFNKLFGLGSGTTPPTNLEGDILQVSYIDVGQGDCIVIQFPDGKNMIIDAGGTKTIDQARAEDKIVEYIDALGIKQFDYLMATHSDGDHVDYLDTVLKQYTVKNIYRPKYRANSESENEFALISTVTYDNFIKAVNDEVVAEDAKVWFNVGEQNITGVNYSMKIYGVDDSDYLRASTSHQKNKVSPICVLEYGGRKMVFTGDAEGAGGGNGAEKEFVERLQSKVSDIDCDVLKVGHHGSETSASQEFLDFFDPEYAIISVGIDNTYGHPNEKFLNRLNLYRDKRPDQDFNGIAQIYRTDQHGDIRLQVGINGGMKFYSQVA